MPVVQKIAVNGGIVCLYKINLVSTKEADELSDG